MNLYFYPVLSWMYPILLCVYPIKSCFNPIVKTVYVALCLSDNPENHFQVTVPTTLTFTFLFYSIVRVSYSIVRLSYPIACILSSFCLSYRENGLSGFAFIMWIGIPRLFSFYGPCTGVEKKITSPWCVCVCVWGGGVMKLSIPYRCYMRNLC